MPTSRLTGLFLIGLGAFTFLATTNQLIPAVAFFPGLLVCMLGTVVFLKANRTALQESEARHEARRNPVIKSTSANKLADLQAATDGRELASLGSRNDRVATTAAPVQSPHRDEVSLRGDDSGDANDQIPGLESETPDEENTAGSVTSQGGSNDQAEGEDEAGFVVTTDVSFPVELQAQGTLADQIAKLRRLADDGIINEDEFAVAKAKLLS
jgi:hypothetical protein